eukprot:jgi/Ulvmu1/2693/UM014_0149.1
MPRSPAQSPRAAKVTSPEGRKELHISNAQKHLHQSLDDLQREQKQHRSQEQRRAQDAKKLLAAADSAISDFEDGSQAWLKLGQQLDTALRQLGDIDNLFDALCDRTSDLSDRIVALTDPAGTPDSPSQPHEAQQPVEAHCDPVQDNEDTSNAPPSAAKPTATPEQQQSSGDVNG